MLPRTGFHSGFVHTVFHSNMPLIVNEAVLKPFTNLVLLRDRRISDETTARLILIHICAVAATVCVSDRVPIRGKAHQTHIWKRYTAHTCAHPVDSADLHVHSPCKVKNSNSQSSVASRQNKPIQIFDWCTLQLS